MWTPLINSKQLSVGTRLRKQILAPNYEVEVSTDYITSHVGENYALLEATATHLGPIPAGQGEIYPLYIGNPAYFVHTKLEVYSED